MTSSAEGSALGRWACDTSVALAALDPGHEAHAACRRALAERRPALAGHAAFEAYSVLTRLPLPLRLSPVDARNALANAFPEPCWLAAAEITALWSRLGDLGIAGGATYDALVAAAAHAAGRTLLTRDQRAERTYRALGVEYEFVE